MCPALSVITQLFKNPLHVNVFFDEASNQTNLLPVSRSNLYVQVVHPRSHFIDFFNHTDHRYLRLRDEPHNIVVRKRFPCKKQSCRPLVMRQANQVASYHGEYEVLS